ncbi:MAG: hypothetical protein LBV16_02250, partial [Elusimicrobiota bacterium]|nr:hypothetical protein [Elusimicrobiota bacterium]
SLYAIATLTIDADRQNDAISGYSGGAGMNVKFGKKMSQEDWTKIYEQREQKRQEAIREAQAKEEAARLAEQARIAEEEAKEEARPKTLAELRVAEEKAQKEAREARLNADFASADAQEAKLILDGKDKQEAKKIAQVDMKAQQEERKSAQVESKIERVEAYFPEERNDEVEKLKAAAILARSRAQEARRKANEARIAAGLDPIEEAPISKPAIASTNTKPKTTKASTQKDKKTKKPAILKQEAAQNTTPTISDDELDALIKDIIDLGINIQ